jgi:hypothetical protein
MAYEATKVFAIRKIKTAIYKQKYTYFTHRHITEACSAVGRSFLFGGGGEDPRKSLNLEPEMSFPGLWGSF